MQCITIIVMGLTKMKKSRAYFYIPCVTVFACAVYYLLGLLLGSNIPFLVRILDALGTVGKILLVLLIIAVVIGVIIYKRKNSKNGG